ncbi:MAG: endolytic transglycosylase MltG [Propionicimonas sp.]
MAWFTRNLRDSETGRISGKEIWLRARSAFAVVLSVGVLVGGGGFVVTQVQQAWTEFRTAEDYVGEGVDPVRGRRSPAGTTLSQIADILVQHDVIKTAKAFDREAAANADSKNIQAGRYKLKTKLPAKLALAMLLDKGNIERNWMTLTEGAAADRADRPAGQGDEAARQGLRGGAEELEEDRPAEVGQELRRGLPLPRHLRDAAGTQGRGGDQAGH